MNKVLYNGCFGGYNFSIDFQKSYFDKIGVKWQESKEKSFGYTHLYSLSGANLHIEAPRHNKILVALVEEWYESGKNPSGRYADIQIATIEGNQYLIDEYDGAETVMEPSDFHFITIKE